MLAQGKKFDIIFIDGWHSFDYAFVDYYYSDLLLNDGGIMVFDDVGMPPIRHVCWFLETHKPYEFLGGPAKFSTLHPWYKLMSRHDRALHELGLSPGLSQTEQQHGSDRVLRIPFLPALPLIPLVDAPAQPAGE